MSEIDGRDLKLAVRAAWFYYVEGQTQERIAQNLGISRVKTTRLLASARETGIVQFRIQSEDAPCLELEQRLKQSFDLMDAVVVPTPIESDNVNRMIGQATGDYLSEFFADDMSIGIGWGRTLTYATRAMAARPLKQASVVSLLGALTHPRGLNPMECAWQFANKLGADCYVLAAPAFVASAELRTALLAQRELSDVMARANRVDAAVVSVGELSPTAPVGRYGFLERDQVRELIDQGAVGDILCHFINAQGEVVDHPINRRVAAFDPTRLEHIPNVIVASGGPQKAIPLYASLRLAKPNIVITDHDTAAQVLQYAEEA
ncbi:sugar-binding transcriptional regulator [Salinisphaera sp.]|uniref:sugar-binding transcriptional regulator n=1 Tax=Salinisphaera sp. TaxID=1914330 RepID=UPI002D79316C|nr:sugar-binding transcriptional regulator [Salinisphaera sp.]HET7315492.1 sugar-binding transcriptional regulator [Salinisphaera sp.]